MSRFLFLLKKKSYMVILYNFRYGFSLTLKGKNFSQRTSSICLFENAIRYEIYAVQPTICTVRLFYSFSYN